MMEGQLQKSKLRGIFPWLMAGATLLLYLATLNHWVTLSSLPFVAKVTGWDWHPGFLEWRPSLIAPLSFLLTWPFHWLPASWQPIALNFFSALGAALTLALLARSIILLPHDRTREQRQREHGEFAFLSVAQWWLPPLLAVVVCGLELTFWEHATAATGEMIDLLVFAYLIRCLLEYRVTHKECWLGKFALVYGLGVTNNCALIGFFPFFFAALIWIKGLSFFNWKFIGRIVAIGLAGLSLYLLMPTISAVQDGTNFWSSLYFHLLQQKHILGSIPRWIPLVLSASTVVPLIIAGIRWPAFEGDLSVAAVFLTGLMFRAMHLLFLAFGIIIFFDLKYSPRGLAPQVSLLTFYYLGALAVGYFSGYALLVFGKEPLRTWERSKGAARLVNGLVVALLWIACVAAPVFLCIRNFPQIQANNSQAIRRFSELSAQSLPANGAVVLSDDHNRLLLARAVKQPGKTSNDIFLETSSLPFPEYHQRLRERYPDLASVLPNPLKLPKVFDSSTLIQLLEKLGQQRQIFYLHPSFGYYFERFYAKPRGLVYELKPYSGDAPAPPLSAQEINENETFWNGFKKEIPALAALEKTSGDIKLLNVHYSRALNLWGVELQKLNRLNEAATRFADALAINPSNVVAQINQEFNTGLRKGQPPLALTDDDMQRKLASRYRSWEMAINYDGPFDEPNYALRFGQALAQGENLRQASQLFQRVLALRPGDPEAQLSMAKTCIDLNKPDQALDLVRGIHAQTAAVNSLELSRVEALAYLGKNDFATAEKVLRIAQQENPKDESRLALLAWFYEATGNLAAQSGQTNLMKQRFDHALATLDKQLQLASVSADILIKKGELQMQLGNNDQAIASFSRLLQERPEHPQGLLDRAIAQLLTKKFDGAKRDYTTLQKLVSKQHVFQISYGLAEIAFQEKDTATAIKNYKLYLKYAPTGTPEFNQATARLKKLESGK